MAQPKLQQYMAALFEPFVKAAERPELMPRLRTEGLLEERKEEQFALLRSAKRWGGEPVLLPIDSFVFRYRTMRSLNLCLQVDGLSALERDRVSFWAADQGLVQYDLDESGFLFLVYDLRSLFKPKSELLAREAAENIIDIVDENYVGHNIFDVKRWYRDVVIFEIPENHIFYNCNNFSIAARIASALASFRSQAVPSDLAREIQGLSELSNVNPENLYFALTATHWKHIFLEIYKCLEAAFFLPWVKKLRDALGHRINALEMAKHCKASLNWREKEKDSIRELFELMPRDLVMDPQIQSIPCFADLKSDSSAPAAYGERVYKIRNQNVHQFDYDSPQPVAIGQEDWPMLASYLCRLVSVIYSDFSDDLRYHYDIKSD